MILATIIDYIVGLTIGFILGICVLIAALPKNTK